MRNPPRRKDLSKNGWGPGEWEVTQGGTGIELEEQTVKEFGIPFFPHFLATRKSAVNCAGDGEPKLSPRDGEDAENRKEYGKSG